MSQIKLEITEDSTDDINTSMQNLIEEADWLLNILGSRSSNSSSNIFDDSNASTSRSSMSANDVEPEPSLEPDISAAPASSQPNYDVGNDSSGSDTTIVLCNNEEPSAGPSNRTPVISLEGNNSFGREVIVIGTPIIEPQRRRQVRRNSSAQDHDGSVIDLSNYQEIRRELPMEPIVILSSDEENDEVAPVATIQQPARPSNRSSFTINNVAVSVHTSSAHSISFYMPNTSLGDISVVEPMPAPILNSTQPAPPPQQRATSNSQTHVAAQGSPKTLNIICPICYEMLANQQAISTSCGHVFCSNCIRQSLRTAKKCPICNKKLTKPSQMHPVYFATG
ncbi:uncharacterized protein LOC128304081 [Anopheles moucheti]|uniref:uncharacterized protein LOC128304081 n=1 Tax=Anopheles moucheti TaxID=186751 RepID=UPI0022F0E972|nr:uncharacterized protein LOC128304081 [Anopheles moucheti]